MTPSKTAVKPLEDSPSEAGRKWNDPQERVGIKKMFWKNKQITDWCEGWREGQFRWENKTGRQNVFLRRPLIYTETCVSLNETYIAFCRGSVKKCSVWFYRIYSSEYAIFCDGSRQFWCWHFGIRQAKVSWKKEEKNTNSHYNSHSNEHFPKIINSLYGNVDTNSLASALAQAQGDLGDGLTPSELISSWADQAGYPVIDAFQNYDDNSFNITQVSLRFHQGKPLISSKINWPTEISLE